MVEPSVHSEGQVPAAEEGVDDDKVCVVAAANAWPFYQLTGAYVCQENRYFQEDSGRLGFYTARLIQGAAPRIRVMMPSVELSNTFAAECSLHTDPVWRRVGEVLSACLDYGWTDEAVEVILLSPMKSAETAKFRPVRHDGKSAWTMKQRYTRLSSLQQAETTDELVIVGRD